MSNAFKKIKRLGLALGVAGLASGCTVAVNHHPPGSLPPFQGTVYTDEPSLGAQAGNPDWTIRHTPRADIDNFQVRGDFFGTVDPRFERGSLSGTQAASEKLAAARATQYFEPWMASVVRTNRQAQRGFGPVLAIGIDPSNPNRAAEEMVNTYNRLADMAWDGNIGQRNYNILQLSRAYEATLRARQNTAMLLQAQPNFNTLLQYAELEGARRVLGKVLTETGTMSGGDFRRDGASTFGLLSGTGIALQDARNGRFGLDEVQLANDRNQTGSISAVGQVENEYMRDVARTFAPDIQWFVQVQQQAARDGTRVQQVIPGRRFGG